MSTPVNSTGTTGSGTSTSRLTGLFSNLDTDAIVKNLCATQQSKVDKASQKKTSDEWLEVALGSVKDTVNQFQNTYCSILGSSSMLKSSTYYSYSVSSDGSGSAVSLSASSMATEGSYSVEVEQLAQQSNVSSSGKVSSDGTEVSANNTATLDSLSLKNKLKFDASGNISFSINGKAFTFSSSTTLQNMINTINTDPDANATMKYSRLTDTFTLASDSGGKDSQLTVKNITGNAFGDNSAFMISEGTVSNGCDSTAVINGTTVTKDSNDYTIDGVDFTLNAVTKGTSNETMNFTVKRDYSATVKAVSSFVDAFNTMITSLTSLTSAKDTTSDYPPLTDAQKSSMSETQIEAWETKAKSGLLSGNSDIESLVTTLKNAFFTAAGGTGKPTTAIGLMGGSYYSADSGKITLDEDALTKALEQNPDQVISMFTGGSSTSSNENQGVIYKIKNAVASYTDTEANTVKSKETEESSLTTEISDLQSKLDDMADRYYNKFSQMETALSKLNSQSSYISQLFSSSGSGSSSS